jgi:hypothetical protein
MRFTATGAVVLTVGCLAFASAALTAHQFLHLSTAVAMAVGICWGLAMVTLDRWLLLTIRRQPHVLATLALALPRVAVAVVAGLVIAVSVVLVAFKNEVYARATYDWRQAMLTALQNVDNKYRPQITSLIAQENNLEQRIATVGAGGAVGNDALYLADSARAARLSTEARAAAAVAQCELDGTCGSGHVGAGPVYTRKELYAEQLQHEAAAAQAGATARAKTIAAEQTAATGQAHGYERSQLAHVRDRLNQVEAKRSHDERTVRRAYAQPIGLADRLDALAELQQVHPSIQHWSELLTILILLLDSAPAVGKALVSIGPQTPYERVHSQQERVAAAAAKADRKARIKAAKIAAQEPVDQAELHRKLWLKELPELLAKVIRTQREATERHIDVWAENTHRRVADWVQVIRHDRDPVEPQGEPPVAASGSANGAGTSSTRARLRRLGSRAWRRR